MSFGKRLKQLRKERGWRQQDVADRLGIPRSNIAAYEATDRQPKDNELLAKLASLFNTSVDYLLGKTDNKAPIEEIHKSNKKTVDLLEILDKAMDNENNDELYLDGVPVDEETAKWLYFQFKAAREKILQDLEGGAKKKAKLGA